MKSILQLNDLSIRLLSQLVWRMCLMDKALIKEAIDSLELIDIHLYTASITRRLEGISSDNYPEKMGQQNKISIKADILESVDDSDDSKLMQAKVEFGLMFIEEGEEGEAKNLAEI